MKRGHATKKNSLCDNKKTHKKPSRPQRSICAKSVPARTRSEQMSCDLRQLPTNSWYGDVVIERTVYQALSLTFFCTDRPPRLQNVHGEGLSQELMCVCVPRRSCREDHQQRSTSVKTEVLLHHDTPLSRNAPPAERDSERHLMF